MQVEQPCNYVVQFTPRFERAYKRKTADQRQAVDKAIVRLISNPGYNSLRVKKVRGVNQQEIWEASITMSRRLTFEYSDDGTTMIMRNCNGHEVFGSP